MVNSSDRLPDLRLATKLVYGYVALSVATLIALVIMTVAAPRLATAEAWGHQIIVTIFAVVLPLRMRAARRGNARATTAVAIIAVVVGLVNLVEALLPAFPVWMRILMIVIVVMMGLLGAVVTGRLAARPSPGPTGVG